jgi:hypothetical protein
MYVTKPTICSVPSGTLSAELGEVVLGFTFHDVELEALPMLPRLVGSHFIRHNLMIIWWVESVSHDT